MGAVLSSGLAAVDTTAIEAVAFDVEYCAIAGQRACSALSMCWMLPFEEFSPVRSFVSYPGQSSFSGQWWFATTGEHVGYESWLERDHLMFLDADPDVVAVASQPFWLSWRQDGQARRHAPDFFARRSDGHATVIDVRADDRIEASDAVAFEATEQACVAVGWKYERVGVIDSVRAANMRWLSGYRHPRCARPGLTEGVLDAFAAPVELLDGAAAVGDPILVLPIVFHLLWSGRLVADLSTVLCHSTKVRIR